MYMDILYIVLCYWKSSHQLIGQGLLLLTMHANNSAHKYGGDTLSYSLNVLLSYWMVFKHTLRKPLNLINCITNFFSCRTYKASLQVPAPAVVEEANDDGSGEVTNQDGQVGHLDVRHGKLHKLLEWHTFSGVKWGHKALSNSMTSLIVHVGQLKHFDRK